MGFNGDVLVGRGDAFVDAVRRMWDWDKEVHGDWPYLDGWRAVHVRNPAFGDVLAAFAEAVGGPVLACWVFESDMGHVRGIGPAGTWEAWLNPGYVAHLRAGEAVDREIGGGLYPDGTPEDHARVAVLEVEYAAESAAERPAAAQTVVAWAAAAGLRADARRVEEILAEPWTPGVQRGFFALLTELGLREAE